jgi:carboxypeptidase C (cathepsin A)
MSMLKQSILLVLLGLILSDDRILYLPDYPYIGEMYSGYLRLSNPQKQLHYMFFPSQNDPESDPVVLWLNGGPGCSSLLGWSQEHGPCVFGEQSDQFELNPYSWNKVANMIYLESPTNVGFSINYNPDDIKTNDIISGQENLQALVAFFQKYPEYKNNDFYISGESYAGIYVPTLAWNVISYNAGVTQADTINLKGILVGNGVTDWNVDTEPALIDFAFTHALYSPEERAEYLLKCVTSFDQKGCDTITGKINDLISSSVNIYDIYRKCYKPSEGFLEGRKTVPFNYTPWLKQFSKERLQDTPPCTDAKGPNEYFNRPDVKVLLNVNTDIQWQMCSSLVEQNYTLSPYGSYYLYKPLIEQKLKILIYSGDSDGAVPFNGSEKWITNLGLNISKPWRSWKISDDKIAGYAINYDGLTYVTVKGTGHMVPQWKPAEAFHMYSSFLKGQDL